VIVIMDRLLVIGNAMTAELLHAYLEQDHRYEIVAFAVDQEYIKTETFHGLPLVDLARVSEMYPPSQCKILLGTGYGNLNRNREGLFSRAKSMGYSIETYIHPDARIYSTDIGEGSIIMANTLVDVYANIGANSVVWSGASVCHHTSIGSNCWMATGSVVSAEANVGDNSFIGVNATVVNQVSMGTHNFIGAGAFIAKNTPDYAVYVSRQTEKFRLSSEEYLRFAEI